MYNFTHEDLVVVQWTNVSGGMNTREQTYMGNIYSQTT